METLLQIVLAVAVFALVFIVYCFQCETIITAIKCTMIVGTIASVLTFILVKYGSD
jgi:hypothetical protein